MKINDNRNYKVQSFNSIYPHIGVVFEWADNFYMTIEEVKNDDGQHYNAVCLNDGKLVCFRYEQVQVLNNVSIQFD